MNKTTRESIFRDAARRMRADFEDVRNNVPHKGEAGGEGEEIVRQFLNAHLPNRYKATNGFVIDKDDNVSGHIDVIIYDALNCPAYRTSEKGMIIPNDNVTAVFEVKFTLTTTTLKSALEKIHELKNLTKTPLLHDHTQGEQIATYGVIFTFESNIKYETVFDYWHICLDIKNPLHNSCSMIVVLDQGLFVTCMDIPGHGGAPADIQGISPSPVGTRIGITYLEYKELTLDTMMRLLLAHLTFFRHRIDHPGFNFRSIGSVPTKWIGEYTADKEIYYIKKDVNNI